MDFKISTVLNCINGIDGQHYKINTGTSKLYNLAIPLHYKKQPFPPLEDYRTENCIYFPMSQALYNFFSMLLYFCYAFFFFFPG